MGTGRQDSSENCHHLTLVTNIVFQEIPKSIMQLPGISGLQERNGSYLLFADKTPSQAY